MKNYCKHLLIILVGGFFSGFAQDDAYKMMLKHTSVVIHKAQKQMMATGKTDTGSELAKAVLLQTYAVNLYDGKNTTAAACASSRAREIATQVILGTGSKDNPYYHLSAEENGLLNSCEAEPQLLLNAQSRLPKMPMKDGDYADPKSLNHSNIDIN